MPFSTAMYTVHEHMTVEALLNDAFLVLDDVNLASDLLPVDISALEQSMAAGLHLKAPSAVEDPLVVEDDTFTLTSRTGLLVHKTHGWRTNKGPDCYYCPRLGPRVRHPKEPSG